MSSILTNNGAMVALQTLRGINKSLTGTQNQIATGKDVANAKDNAAVWAISKVMESDVAGFKAISDNLGLGESTVAVARNAAETTTELLKQMKTKIVSAQESNVDRVKIQADIEALRDQIGSVTSAAQFNGLNMLTNDKIGVADSNEVNILSSLDRSGTGVTASQIVVDRQDLRTTSLSTDTGVLGAMGFDATNSGTNTVTANTTGPQTVSSLMAAAIGTASDTAPVVGTVYRVNTVDAAGDEMNGVMVSVREGESRREVLENIASALTFALQSAGKENFTVVLGTDTAALDGLNGDLNLINSNTDNTTSTMVAQIRSYTVTASNTVITTVAGGGLEMLQSFDVTTDGGATAALTAVETMIQKSIDSAAAFGSVEGRIETQSDFVSSLMDSMKSGIGTLIDADMEEASARLQALQVQQQLGTQALSIANQAPQQLLSLFR